MMQSQDSRSRPQMASGQAYTFRETTPDMLLGPCRDRTFDHWLQSDHVSATVSYELGSVRSTTSQSWVGRAAGHCEEEMVYLGSSCMEGEPRPQVSDHSCTVSLLQLAPMPCRVSLTPAEGGRSPSWFIDRLAWSLDARP